MFFHRDPEERLARREKPAHQEPLDPPVHADPLEMTVPRATPYVTSTVTHTRAELMTDALLKLSAAESLCHISQWSCLLSEMLLTPCQMSESGSVFSVSRSVCRVLSASQETPVPLESLVLL